MIFGDCFFVTATMFFYDNDVFFLTTTMSFFNDNRDNRNNKKNGRNCGMSRGDIKQRQRDYCCRLVNYVLFLEDNKITVLTRQLRLVSGRQQDFCCQLKSCCCSRCPCCRLPGKDKTVSTSKLSKTKARESRRVVNGKGIA